MKSLFTIFITLILFTTNINAQMLSIEPYQDEAYNDYSIEVQVMYENKPLSKIFNNNGNLQLAMGMPGKLSLQIVDNIERLGSVDQPRFQIAIKDNETGTQRMYSNDVYSDIIIENVINDCKQGESIIIMTTQRIYSLPKNEIRLLLGC